MQHPEHSGVSGLEPTVGEQLRLHEALQLIERASEPELRHLCRLWAQQVLVTHPAALRWLAREAAANLGGQIWSADHSQQLMQALALPSPREE